MNRRPFIAVAAALAAGIIHAGCDRGPLSSDEWAIAETLSIDALPPLPPDPSNRVANSPEAAAFGRLLFFDTRLSRTGAVACATCHLPDRQFQDDKPLATAIGVGVRRTMPIEGTAWGPWFFWDGRKDSQWSQALGPLEDPVEHGSDRATLVRYVLEAYQKDYQALFGPPPTFAPGTEPASPLGDAAARQAWFALSPRDQDAINRAFSNMGKAIAAFERTLGPKPSRLDRFLGSRKSWRTSAAADRLTAQERDGLKLFVGKARCVTCHEGPRLTDDHFHNTGVAKVPGLPPDRGRAGIFAAIDADPFNCLGPYSDAKSDGCGELRFMSRNAHELMRAYKVPSLRGVADRPPYMHAGQLKTLSEVIDHYNAAPPSPEGHSELKPLNLTAGEKAALVASLKTLSP